LPSDPRKEPPRLLDKVELLKRVPLSFPTIWKMMRDGTFPRSLVVSGGTKTVWLESEVTQWILSRPRTVLMGDDLRQAEAE
jgi:predicted DNA-binding transcriptional regulator AlpA